MSYDEDRIEHLYYKYKQDPREIEDNETESDDSENEEIENEQLNNSF